MNEVSDVNNDINNLLTSTDIGTIFLDTDLCIKRFTPAMTNIFNLIQTDIGRPISDITSKIRYENLKEDGNEVLKTLIHKEARVQDNNGSWFTMRISPYRTTENVIDGIVITFVDITKTAITEEELRVSEERFRSIFEQTSESIVLVDVKTGAFIEFNERAHMDLGYSRAEFAKLTLFDLEADESSE